MPKYAAALKLAGTFVDQDEAAQLALRLAVKPKPAVALDGYIAWTRELKPMLVAAGTFIDQDERSNMQRLITAKACAPAASPDALAAWNTLAAGANGEASSILEAAKPAAGCM